MLARVGCGSIRDVTNPFSLRRLFLLCLLPAGLLAQSPVDQPSANRAAMTSPAANHDQDRQEMLKILDQVQAAINGQSMDKLVALMTPQTTVTWLNGEVSRGPEEVKSYYYRMVQGPERILTKYETSAKIAAPARFLGDGTIAVADGTSHDHFTPAARGFFELDSRWSTTLQKIDGQWKIINLHLSANVFNNNLLDEVKQLILYVGAGCLVAGLALGYLASRFLLAR